MFDHGFAWFIHSFIHRELTTQKCVWKCFLGSTSVIKIAIYFDLIAEFNGL